MASFPESTKAIQMGTFFDLKVGNKTHKVAYMGDNGGWLTFKTVTGAYQVFQYTPETLPVITPSAAAAA